MSDLPYSPLNPVQPSDFMKNDIPAETDDLELGKKGDAADDRKPAPDTDDIAQRR